jgi:hypothetical protein
MFARALLSLERHLGRPLSKTERREAFEQWYALAKPFLRLDQTKDQYFMEFIAACRDAKHPLEDSNLTAAWKLAQEQPPPPEAMQFEDPQLRLLVALCYQLQVLAGNAPFYLASRTVQKLFGHPTHTTAWTWLRALVALGILDPVNKGNAHKAARYRYLSTTVTT